jgi:hypothetical protein
MMVVVAIAAMGLGLLAERRSRFAGVAARYRDELADVNVRMNSLYPHSRLFPRFIHRAEWARQMSAKYERAARYPWLPVEPNPSEPGPPNPE